MMDAQPVRAGCYIFFGIGMALFILWADYMYRVDAAVLGVLS